MSGCMGAWVNGWGGGAAGGKYSDGANVGGTDILRHPTLAESAAAASVIACAALQRHAA